MTELIPFPTELEPRITRTTLNTEIEQTLRANLKHERLNRLLSSTDNDTAYTKKYHGDRWLAAECLRELAKAMMDEKKGNFPAILAASTDEIRSHLYVTVLPRVGQDRKTRLKAYAEAKRLAAHEVEKEAALDHSGE